MTPLARRNVRGPHLTRYRRPRGPLRRGLLRHARPGFRFVHSGVGHASHCREPIVRHGRFKDGKVKRWTVDACAEHANELAGGVRFMDRSDEPSPPPPSEPPPAIPPDRPDYGRRDQPPPPPREDR